MRATVRLGRIGGIPIGLHWSVFVAVLLIGSVVAVNLPGVAPGLGFGAYLLWGCAGAAVFLLSLLAHELAHALVARRTGTEVRAITLWLLGGVSELGGQPKRPAAEAGIAFAGPLTSAVLGAAFAAGAVVAEAAGGPDLLTAVLAWLAVMNVVLAVFNLLPGTPLDGGRVVHALLWGLWGDRDRASRAAGSAGQVLGLILAGIGLFQALDGRWDGLWLVLVGWFVASAAAGESARALMGSRVAGVQVGEIMTRRPVTVPAWLSVQQLVSALTAPDAPRHRVFPVVGATGELVGVVSQGDLARVPAADRPTTPLRTVTRAVPGEWVLTADSPLDPLLDRPLTHGQDLAVVVEDGAVIGVVGPDDLARTVERRGLLTDDRAKR